MSTEAVAMAMGIAFEQALNVVWKSVKRCKKPTHGWQSIVNEKDARRKWIIYNTIPEATKRRVDHYYGDVQKAYHAEQMIKRALALVEITDKSYYMEKGGICEKKCDDLAEACGWMRLMISDYHKGRFSGKIEFQKYAVRVIAQRDLYGMKVSSERALQRKIKGWKNQGRDSLIPRRFGNTNSKKINQDIINRLIDLYADPKKPTYVDVATVYNGEREQYGWPALSTERIRQILKAHESITSAVRHGVEASRNLQEASFKRRRASFADAIWSMDGTTVQLYYTEDGKTRCSNLYIYAVIDSYSGSIIGYDITEGRGEPAATVQRALKNAVKRTGHAPIQVQYDNSSANKSAECQQLFAQLARVGFACAPYNGKAKRIESIFGRVEQSNMRLMPNFKGGNITTRSLDSKANPDYILQLERSGMLPTKAEALKQVELIIQTHNYSVWRKGQEQTRIERYNTAHPSRKPLDAFAQIVPFLVQRKRPVTYTKDGLIIEIEGERLYYVVEQKRGIESRAFREQYLGTRFEIKYDPDDIEQVYLFYKGVYKATAVQKYEFAEAVIDALPGEGEILHEAMKMRQEDLRRHARKIAAIKQEQRELGREIISHKSVHKAAYNKMEQDGIDELIQEAGRIIEPINKSRKRYDLYDDSDADGSIILDND
jgi:hypothetical protein